MVEIPVDGLHGPAQARADGVPALRHSMRGTAGNEVGAMGELVATRYLASARIGYEEDLTYDHDLIVAGRTVDVKTKERTVPPLPHYDCTVPEYNREQQQPDIYLFVSLLSDGGEGCARFVRAWVLGSMSRRRFEEMSQGWQPGMMDLSNGWRPTIACRNVRVADLNPTATIGAADILAQSRSS